MTSVVQYGNFLDLSNLYLFYLFFFFFNTKSVHYVEWKFTILLELYVSDKDENNVKMFSSNFSLASTALSIAILGLFSFFPIKVVIFETHLTFSICNKRKMFQTNPTSLHSKSNSKVRHIIMNMHWAWRYWNVQLSFSFLFSFQLN